MKKCILFICAFSIYLPCGFTQIENVKKKTDLQWINDSICYDNGNDFTGEVIDYSGQKFDKAKLLYDGHFVNGQRNGTIKKWYSNFKIEFIENFKMGKKEGIQTYFYNSGNKKSECKYSNGLRDGICNEWYDNKQQKCSYAFVYGNLADGSYFTYFENGQKEKEELYSDGLKISERIFKNDTLYESLELKAEYDPVKKENSKGFLKNNRKDGLWTYWYDGVKKKKEGHYKDGIEDGKWFFWFDDGGIEYEGTCKNGLREGQGVLHNIKGEPTYTGGFKNDKRDGFGTITWKDGNINYQGEFKNGKPDGKGTTYDNGKVIYDGDWKDGQRNGKGTWHDYKNGFLITGDWVNGSFTGQGIMTKTDKDGIDFIFSGEFKDMKLFNGTFHMNKPDGSKYIQEYKEGKEGKLKKNE